MQRVRTAAALELPVCAHRIRQPPLTTRNKPPHPELDLTQPSTTEQSGNLLNMLMCQASSATKSPAATWLRLQSGLNGEGVEWNGGRSGVGSVLASYVQHPKWTTRSPLSHRVPEYQFRDGEGRCSVQFALLQKLILHSSLSAAVSVAFHFFLFPPCFALTSSFAAVSIWFYCRCCCCCCSCCFCFYYLTRRISACLAFYYFWGFCAFYFATLLRFLSG